VLIWTTVVLLLKPHIINGVFPFRRIPLCRIPFSWIPFCRMPCKIFFPPFSFFIPFITAIHPFYGCQQNARKNITVTVSVRVSVTVRVSLVWRHRHFLFRKISKWHGFSANWDSAKRDSAKWVITIINCNWSVYDLLVIGSDIRHHPLSIGTKMGDLE